MSDKEKLNISTKTAVALFLELLCFLLDLYIIPYGSGKWALYFFPLLLVSRTNKTAILVTITFASLLQITALFINPPAGNMFFMLLMGRIAGMLVNWTVSLIAISRLRYMRELRRKAEYSLNWAEKNQAVIDQMSEGFLSLNPDGSIVYANLAFERLIGISFREGILHVQDLGSRIAMFSLDGTRLDISQWPTSLVLEQKKFADVLFRVSGSGNREFTGNFSGTPVYDAQGRFILAVMTCTDVTVSRRLEEQVYKQALMLDQVQDAVVTINNEERIQYMNDAAYRQYDIDRSEPVLGSKLGEFFRFEWQNPQQFEHYEQSIKNDGFWKGEKIHVTHKGRRIWGESMISLAKDSAGNPTGVIAVVRDISERRKAQLELEESRERLRLANEAAGIGTWSLDPQTGEMEWDAITRGHWGLTEDEYLTFEKLNNFTFPEDLKKMNDAIPAIRHNQSVTIEIRVIHPDKSIHFLRSTGRGIHLGEQHAFRIIGTSLDITEQKRLEQALRDQAQGLEFLSSTAVSLLEPLGSSELYQFITDRVYDLADGAIVFFSEFDYAGRRTIVRAAGCTEEERAKIVQFLGTDIIGLTFNFREDTRSRMLQGELSHVEGGVCDLAFYQLPQALCDAIERELNIGDIFAMPCVLKEDILGIVAILTHSRGKLRNSASIESIVSQTALAIRRIRTEEALQNERNFLNTILDTQGAIVAILDKDFKIIRLNRGYSEFTGCQADGMLGHSFWDLMAISNVEMVKQQLQDLVTTRKTGEYENLICVKDHMPRYIRWRNTTIQNNRGEVEFIIATGLDISDRIEAEESIKRLNKELEKRAGELEYANRELESFSYSVSHDLRSPLRAMIGFSRILLEEHSEGLTDEGRNLARSIIDNGNRMNVLIDDIMDLSRVARQEMLIRTVDLSAIAESVVSELRKAQPDRRIEISVQKGCVVDVDYRLMKIALTNLIGNSWKYTRYKQDPRIEFGCSEKDNEIFFYVRDNGAGFDMRYKDKLFQPFRRLHSEKEFTGTGIGLATVARIINRHHGRIWAEGEVGKGAVFYFTIKN